MISIHIGSLIVVGILSLLFGILGTVYAFIWLSKKSGSIYVTKEDCYYLYTAGRDNMRSFESVWNRLLKEQKVW